MSRPLRIEYPGAVYHLTARANGRQKLFTNTKDANLFIELLAREIAQQRWICHAYCLLEDHYHLVIETPEMNLSRGIGRLNMSYSQWFGRVHNETGHLFHGRYKSIILQKDPYLLQVCRHVVLNPVRIQAVNQADQWRWSSYRALALTEPKPIWLQCDWINYRLSGGKRGPATSWKDFVAKGINEPSPWEDLIAGHYLGDAKFLTEITERINKLSLNQVSRKITNPARPTPKKIFQSVSAAAKIPEALLLDRVAAPEAFQAVVYLLRRASNLPLQQVAELAGVSQSRISQIQRKIEDEGGISSTFTWGKMLTELL